jgi:hypothetical protein
MIVYMSKFLFLVKNYVYKACNPTILNVSNSLKKEEEEEEEEEKEEEEEEEGRKKKTSLGLLDYRPK